MKESAEAYQNEMDKSELDREFEEIANDIIEEAIKDLDKALYEYDPITDYNDFTEAR